jgi:hypothetical protein
MSDFSVFIIYFMIYAVKKIFNKSASIMVEIGFRAWKEVKLLDIRPGEAFSN